MKFEKRRILSLVSGCLVHTVFGSTYSLGTITPYVASYLKYHGNENIQVVDIAILYPLLMILQNIGIIVSMVKLQQLLPMKLICFIGTTGFALSAFVSSFMTSYFGYCLFYGAFFGFFAGLAYMMPFKNTYSYFPHRKGMCAGLCMMGYGIGSFTYNQIFLKIVNPHNVPADKDHFFPQEVADRFPLALMILSIIYFTLGIIAALLFYPLQEEDKIKLNQNSLISSTHSEEGEADLPKQKVKIQQVFKYLSENPNKRMQLIKVGFIVLTSPIFGVFIGYNYKEYGQTVVNNDTLLTLAGSIGSLSNSLGRIIWCSTFDYLSFRTIMTILNSSLLVYCIGCYFITNGTVYTVIVILTYFSLGAFYGLMPTQVVRIVGEKYGTIIYPFVFIAFTLAAIIQFSFHEAVIRNMGNDGFKIAFIIFGIFQAFSLIFVQVFKFQYTPEEQNKLKRKR